MKNPSPLRVWGATSPCPGAPFNLRCFDLLLKRYIPIGSMYGIFTNIYHKNQPNVGIFTNIYHIYTIHDMDPMGYLIFKWSWWRWSYCMLLRSSLAFRSFSFHSFSNCWYFKCHSFLGSHIPQKAMCKSVLLRGRRQWWTCVFVWDSSAFPPTISRSGNG